MTIPTEPIGSIPRPLVLIDALKQYQAGQLSQEALDDVYEDAVRDTIERLEATGSPVITDGEQRKYRNFASYPVDELRTLQRGGFVLHFADGHDRFFPLLTSGPFRYQIYADSFLELALRYAHVAVKQAVISPSFQSLLYPSEDIPGYPRDQFIEDVLSEHVKEIRNCLSKGAHNVQIDFTEGRLAVKLDPSGQLLNSFIHLNNLALERFTPEERKRIGVHTCPGGDCDSTHSADVDYAELLPSLFELQATNFYLELAREPDRLHVLQIVRACVRPGQRVFVGVIDPLDPRVETPQEVCNRVLEAARYLTPEQLGTTDDCGFSPFYDDISTTRDTAFAKIRARVVGTAMAAKSLGLNGGQHD